MRTFQCEDALMITPNRIGRLPIDIAGTSNTCPFTPFLGSAMSWFDQLSILTAYGMFLLSSARDIRQHFVKQDKGCSRGV